MPRKSNVSPLASGEPTKIVPTSKQKAKIKEKKEVEKFCVLVSYKTKTGRPIKGFCENVYQTDMGHPSSGDLMNWKAAEYTARVMGNKFKDAKYTIHKIGPALQREPQI